MGPLRNITLREYRRAIFFGGGEEAQETDSLVSLFRLLSAPRMTGASKPTLVESNIGGLMIRIGFGVYLQEPSKPYSNY